MNSPTTETFKIPVLEVDQPIGEFFIGILPARVLRQISYSDIRRLRDRSVEAYTGIERPLSPQRVAEIKAYIRNIDATFPNSIIISIKREDITADIIEEGRRLLTVRMHENAAKIIDGQHRLAGFEDWNGDSGFDLVAAIFIEMDEEDQATVFATINLKQTKVSRSLVYDLFELTKTRSPQKTCHDIAKTLNSEDGSPFYHRIKLLGRNPDLYKGTVTQGTFIKYLLPKVSTNPDADRNKLKKGEKINARIEDIKQGLIFRGYFILEEDWAILRVMRNFFFAVAATFPRDWADTKNNPLPRAIGYGACMRVLTELFQEGHRQKDLSEEFFKGRVSRAAGKLTLTFQNYPANAGGEKKLADELSSAIGGLES